MPRDNVSDLLAFLAVARESSFTRAAAKMGVSQSALSHAVRGLEARLGMRLLTRTTRKVSLTIAGERLMNSIGPHFEQIEREVTALGELRDKPAGLIRISCSEHPAEHILRPVLEKFLPDYPDITVELVVDNGLTDIVAERFDAGVRLGEQVAKDMVAVRIGPEVRMLVVATPAYFAAHGVPESPEALTSHTCINLRMVSSGALYAWELEKEGHEIKVRVEGQFISSSVDQVCKAAVAGLGIAFVPSQTAEPYLRDGRLQAVLEDWCPSFPGFHIYYPSRRHSSPAFSLLLEALKYRD